MNSLDPNQMVIYAGCIAAAGSIMATPEGCPEPIRIINYADELYAEYLNKVNNQ